MDLYVRLVEAPLNHPATGRIEKQQATCSTRSAEDHLCSLLPGGVKHVFAPTAEPSFVAATLLADVMARAGLTSHPTMSIAGNGVNNCCLWLYGHVATAKSALADQLFAQLVGFLASADAQGEGCSVAACALTYEPVTAASGSVDGGLRGGCVEVLRSLLHNNKPLALELGGSSSAAPQPLPSNKGTKPSCVSGGLQFGSVAGGGGCVHRLPSSAFVSVGKGAPGSLTELVGKALSSTQRLRTPCYHRMFVLKFPRPGNGEKNEQPPQEQFITIVDLCGFTHNALPPTFSSRATVAAHQPSRCTPLGLDENGAAPVASLHSRYSPPTTMHRAPLQRGVHVSLSALERCIVALCTVAQKQPDEQLDLRPREQADSLQSLAATSPGVPPAKLQSQLTTSRPLRAANGGTAALLTPTTPPQPRRAVVRRWRTGLDAPRLSVLPIISVDDTQTPTAFDSFVETDGESSVATASTSGGATPASLSLTAMASSEPQPRLPTDESHGHQEGRTQQALRRVKSSPSSSGGFRCNNGCVSHSQQHVPFYGNLLTKLVQGYLDPEPATTTCALFVLSLSTEKARLSEAIATIGFGRRALGLPQQATDNGRSAAIVPAARVAVSTSIAMELEATKLAAVRTLQRWYRCLRLLRRNAALLAAEEAKKRQMIEAWEASEGSVFGFKFVESHTSALASGAARQRRRPRSAESAVAATQTERTLGTSEAAVQTAPTNDFVRSRGVQCMLSDAVAEAAGLERDEWRAEALRLKAQLEQQGSQWKYMLEKNVAQRQRITELERQLARFLGE